MRAVLSLTFALASAYAVQTPSVEQRFIDTVRAHFDAWDTNHDGQLSDDELLKVIEDRTVVGDEAAASATIRTQYHRKGHELAPLTKTYFDTEESTLPGLVKAFRASLSRISAGLKSPLFQAEGPTLVGCKQGAIGDCYLVAATGAVLVRDPQVIVKMIQVDPSNLDYRVSYPDGIQVAVQPYTQGELALGGGAFRDGLWLRVLEKAWARRRAELSGKADETTAYADVIGHGGVTRTVAEAMTGHAFRGYRLGDSKGGPNVTVDDLRNAIKDAVQAKRIMVTGITKTSVPGLSSKHAYTILGYDSTSDLITVWNPHVNRFNPKGPDGPTNGYKTTAGSFQVLLSEFRDIFNGISIETDRPNKIRRAGKS